jgi:asparagine synthase (glutamine-hydrolysing)
LLRLSTPPRPARNEYRIGAAQRSSVSRWPLPLYLRIEDRNSMAHSVEARLPFTDYRIVEHALRMPDQLKHAGGLNKIALRKIAARHLPPSVLSRIDKFGFPVSTNATNGRRLHALCSELAASRQFRERGIYSLPAIRKLLADFSGDQPSHVSAVFDLAQCELWLRGMGRRHVAPVNARAVA